MLTLGIETSNPAAPARSGPACGAGVALTDGPPGRLRLLGFEPLDASRRHDDALMPAIDRLCARAGVGARQIRQLAVSVGPGGFTGVRIAVAAAQMIALATGARAIPVPTSRALSLRVSDAARQRGPFVIALAWKRDDVWAQRFEARGAGAHEASPGEVVSHEALCKDGARTLIAEEAFEDLLRARALAWPGVVERPCFSPLAVIEAAQGLSPVDPAQLLPVYPREPEAVRLWNQRDAATPRPGASAAQSP